MYFLFALQQDSSDSNSYMHTRKKTKKSGSKRFAQNEERANNRLTTRALYDTDVEEVRIEKHRVYSC